MLTLELPVLVRVTLCVMLLPTDTLPKLRLVGLAESCSVAATPLPLSGMAVGEPGALLTSETLPVTLPTPAGAKATLKFVLCPGVNVKGSVSPLVAKPLPETVACESDKLAVPVFLSDIVSVILVTITTYSNLTHDGTYDI